METNPLDLGAIKARAASVAGEVWKTRECEDYYQGGTYICLDPEAKDGEYWDICRVHGGCEDFLLNAPSDIAYLLARVEALEAALNIAENRLRPKWGKFDDGRGTWVLRAEVKRPDGHTLRQDWLVSEPQVALCDNPKRLLFDEISHVAKNVVNMAVDGPAALAAGGGK